MENKITLYTFKKSNEKECYNESLVMERKKKIEKFKKELKNQETDLNKLLEFQNLSEVEIEEYKSYKNDIRSNSKVIIEIFSEYIKENISSKKSGYPLKKSADFLLPSIEQIEEAIESLKNKDRVYFTQPNRHLLADSTPVEKLKYTFIKKLSEKLSDRYDLQKINKIKKQYSIRAEKLKEEIEERKKLISQFENQDRIQLEDIENLNEEILIMNKKGWNIKQIENIQSGRTSFIHKAGAGYSFTKGILIVWEK